MATQVYRRERTKGRGINCLVCGDRHWTPYQVETVDGQWEEAWELCADCSPKTSTKHITVDDQTAEVLERDFREVFEVVDIRECLEFEPMKKVRALLAWATEHEDPYGTLRAYAEKNRTGHYRYHRNKPSGVEEHQRFLRFRARKQAERGYLSQSQEEDLAREFYAPSFRAEQRRLQKLGVAS